jgi:threonine dehydratase
MKTSPLTLDSLRQAQTRLNGGVRLTSCARSTPLCERLGMEIYCKRDIEQVTGSFKERGARNALLSLSEEERRRGVIAASAGNHALGLARHGGLLGVPVWVVMPLTAPTVKVDRCREFGAQVLLHGNSFDEAASHALALSEANRLTYVHPFDDLAVIAGQGTLGLEVLEQVPGLDAIVVPVGGGGLLAGVLTAVRALRPHVEVIAVEPAHAPSLAVATAEGRPVSVPVSPTLADGLAVARVGRLTFALAHGRVDRVVTVTEDEIAEAMLLLAEEEGTVVEGAGATALAACLSGKLEHLRGRRVVLPLCGRNVDPAVHRRALARARAARAWSRAA